MSSSVDKIKKLIDVLEKNGIPKSMIKKEYLEGIKWKNINEEEIEKRVVSLIGLARGDYNQHHFDEVMPGKANTRYSTHWDYNLRNTLPTNYLHGNVKEEVEKVFGFELPILEEIINGKNIR